MNCAEFEAQLQQLLDERAPLAELPQPLREAAANDPACAQILQAYQALEAAMKVRPLPQPPAHLTANVLAKVALSGQAGDVDDEALFDDVAAVPAPASQAAEPARGHRRWVLVWSAAAVAASLLIGVLFVAVEPGDDAAGPGQVANHPADQGMRPSQGAVAEHAPPAPLEDMLVPDERQAAPSDFASLSELALRQYESLAAETKASLSDVAVLVPQYELGSVEVADASTMDDTELPVDRLRPFKETTRGAVGLLMRFTPQ